MTGPPVVQQDDPVAAYKRKYGGAQAPAGNDPVAEYKAKYGGAGMTDLLKEGGILPGADPATRLHFDYRSGALQKRNAEAHTKEVAADEQAMKDATPGYVKALGVGASLNRDIPGAEAMQAGLRSIVRRQPYSEARSDIRTAEDAAPAAATIPARLAGGTLAAMALPKVPGLAQGGVARQGAQFGAASGLLQSDPNAGVKERLWDATQQAALGSIAGKASEIGTNMIRVGRAPTTGANQMGREAAREAEAGPLYDAARAEAAAGGGTSPGVKAVLNHPLVKPMADDIRASFKLQGKPTDDATVLMQANRELSQNERALIDRQAGAPSSRPLTKREQGDVQAVKQMLRNAASQPSEKPPLHLDIAGETSEVAPRVTPGREPMLGPMSRGAPAKVLPGHETIPGPMRGGSPGTTVSGHDAMTGPMMEGTAGTARGSSSQVAVEPSGRVVLVSPRDVQGPAGPSFVLRAQPGQVTPAVPARPGFVLRGQPEQVVSPEVPSRPAFQLRGQPDKVTPGVRIETPAMRVQTAPAEKVPGLMPSLPKADAAYAEHSGELKAMQDAADAADRFARGKRTTGKNLGKKSPEKVQAELKALKEGKAKASTEGILGEMKNNLQLSVNPFTGFGIGKSAVRMNRVGPYLRTLDQTTGGDPASDLLRALGISQAGTSR